MNSSLTVTQSQQDADMMHTVTGSLAKSLEALIRDYRPFNFRLKYLPTSHWSISDDGNLIITINAQLVLPL